MTKEYLLLVPVGNVVIGGGSSRSHSINDQYPIWRMWRTSQQILELFSCWKELVRITVDRPELPKPFRIFWKTFCKHLPFPLWEIFHFNGHVLLKNIRVWHKRLINTVSTRGILEGKNRRNILKIILELVQNGKTNSYWCQWGRLIQSYWQKNGYESSSKKKKKLLDLMQRF